ncbi:MAG: 50S ribosomal protein L10 [Candidatus Brockarchaeota archaeon]|nr:50S ribosomal protein L10 [Candidatus Brockarchaeota archaeon]
MRASIIAKSSLVDNLERKFQNFATMAIVDLRNVRGKQINEARKALRGLAEFRQVKPTIMKLALKKVEGKIPGIEKLSSHVHGMMLLVFSNLDPFKLQSILKKNVVKLYAKAGEIAQDDIVVPAGNTGIPPGPVISELNTVGIPTRIDTGSVWITKDTVVAKKGEKIAAHLAAVLSKLNIAPISSFLVLRAAYHGGSVFASDILQIDPEKVRQEVAKAYGTPQGRTPPF